MTSTTVVAATAFVTIQVIMVHVKAKSLLPSGDAAGSRQGAQSSRDSASTSAATKRKRKRSATVDGDDDTRIDEIFQDSDSDDDGLDVDTNERDVVNQQDTSETLDYSDAETIVDTEYTEAVNQGDTSDEGPDGADGDDAGDDDVGVDAGDDADDDAGDDVRDDGGGDGHASDDGTATKKQKKTFPYRLRQQRKTKILQEFKTADTYWSLPDKTAPIVHEFTAKSEINADTTDFLPHEYFKLFMTDSLIDEIVIQTNKYADDYIRNTHLKPHSRANEWEPVTAAEMKSFLGQ